MRINPDVVYMNSNKKMWHTCTLAVGFFEITDYISGKHHGALLQRILRKCVLA